MKPQIALVLVCLLGSSLSLPMQIGILASNSNEILRLNGLTLATLGQTQLQASPFIPQYMLPDMGLTPQVVNFNPQMAGPFGPQGPQLLIPSQGNQLILPNGQQEQAVQDPGLANGPQQPQNPMQMIPQYNYPYGFGQQRMQGYPYYMPPYGYPQQRNPMMMQPNNNNNRQGQVQIQVPGVQPQQNLEKTTQKPQLPLQQAAQPKGQPDKTLPTVTQTQPATLPTVNRGDTAGPGVDEGHSNFPFLFEP